MGTRAKKTRGARKKLGGKEEGEGRGAWLPNLRERRDAHVCTKWKACRTATIYKP